METGVFFFHFSFFDDLISSAVGITVLFILHGEKMAVMSVRFFIFFFIFLKKEKCKCPSCTIWVFCFYSDDSILQTTKIKMLHYAHLIHAFSQVNCLSFL